jgi:hypothetical protein
VIEVHGKSIDALFGIVLPQNIVTIPIGSIGWKYLYFAPRCSIANDDVAIEECVDLMLR